MALSEIINKFNQSKEKEGKEYLLAIEIWEGEVKSAIWAVEEGKTKVVALGSRETWERQEELVEAADRSLTQASERFTETGKEPSKVIFGLPENWTDEKEIKPEYRQLLQELYQKLELKPVGYVLTFDALVHHLKKVEGVPPTVILVKMAKTKINLTVVEVGKKAGVEEVSRSENLAHDLREGLARMTKINVLPSRILLFDGEEMEDGRQNLIAYPWLKPLADGSKLAFLHLPKVEILPVDFDINAVALAGGSEVAKSLGFEIKEEIAVEGKEEKTPEETAPEEPSFAEASEGEEADFGFVRDKDISEIRKEFKPVVEEEPEILVEETRAVEPEIEPEIESERAEERLEKRKPGWFLFLSGWLGKIPRPKMPLPFLPGLPILGILLGGTMLILGGLFFAFAWFIPRAEVTVLVKPKILEKEFKLTVDPNQEVVDRENLVLPGKTLETETSGEKSSQTTGEKLVGDKTKGEATIYNRTDGPKTFEKGALIAASGGLKFSLDEEVKIASKTPDLSTGVDKWGESKVGVTAVEIGAQYNLAAGTQFSLENYPQSSFLAKNESDFSGGTSRKIQAVSEEDQNNLRDDLSKELAEGAEGELLAKVSPDQSLISESILTDPISEDFDYQVGDEAQNLNLKLSVKITSLTFNRGEFVELVSGLLGDSITSDYQLQKEEIQSKFEIEEKNEDGSLLFNAHIKANLIPKMEAKEIVKNIKGKYQNLAKDYLRIIPGYVDSEILIQPRLPGFLSTLPRREERINVKIKSQ